MNPLPTPADATSAPETRTLDTDVAVIGGGPAGLMAAEVLQAAGHAVHVLDAMPSVGRKFLLAGKGGLNISHSEPAHLFASRYGSRSAVMEPLLGTFDADALRAWVSGLGVETFVGSSGRIFPTDMKSAPLLRAWLHRLRHPQQGQPVVFHMRHRWTGWDPSGRWLFDSPAGPVAMQARAVVLALGGGSWARLGSDGAWVTHLQARGIDVAPLLASNCGFDVAPAWSPFFAQRFAGQPLKTVALELPCAPGASPWRRKGEMVATATGLEGSLVYAASGPLREALARDGQAVFLLDLLPDLSVERVHAEISHPRGARSLASHLKSRLRLDGIKSALLHELLPKAVFDDAAALAAAIKALPIRLAAARPLDEAISSAGGVRFEALSPEFMTGLPGVFCAGEMLDWEAPTGGYLLHACLATGRQAGQGACNFLFTPQSVKIRLHCS